MTKDIDNSQPGPLRLPPSPPDVATARAVEKLQGHSTAANWLPEGEWPELDELRTEQLRLRGQVAAELSRLAALESRFRKEDADHTARLREAQRAGQPDSVEDRRTPNDQRVSERAAIEERLWAGVMVLAEVAEAVITTVRERDGDWLADLRARLEPAQEKRRQADRLLAEAKAEEFKIYKLGQWVQAMADDEGFGRQPALTLQPVPSQFSWEVLKDALERPWHKVKDWHRATTENVA